MRTSLGQIAEGTIPPMIENGSKVDYIVAKHNYNSAVNGTGHTLLVRGSVLGSWRWSDNYTLPDDAVWSEESSIPAGLESYYQSAFDEWDLAAIRPMTIRCGYGDRWSYQYKNAENIQFFIPSAGDISSGRPDGDPLSADVLKVIAQSIGSGRTLHSRSSWRDSSTDSDGNETYYSHLYRLSTSTTGFGYTDSYDEGGTSRDILPCFVMNDTAGVGTDGILHGNRAPEVQSYYFGMETMHGKWQAFRVPYSVHDEDGDGMRVTELLDGIVVRTYTPEDGETNYFTVTSEMIAALDFDEDHALTVRVTDGAASS